MQYLLISIGVAGMLLVLADFFYTTLSSNGSGWLTKHVNQGLSRVLLPSPGGKINKWVGLMHLFISMSVWIILVDFFAFLVYISTPDMVVDASNQLPAGNLERLYFTTYVFSTLGNGDYAPGNDFCRAFTSIFSITGFAMLTTGITYLLSVTNAVLVKKNLASLIAGMGDNPFLLHNFFTSSEKADSFLEKSDSICELLIQHSNNHLSYPIVHYFITGIRNKSVSIQIASLFEVCHVLEHQFPDHLRLQEELRRIERHLNDYIAISSTTGSDHHEDQQKIRNYRQKWSEIIENYDHLEIEDKPMARKLTDLLHSQGWSWSSVYPPYSGMT